MKPIIFLVVFTSIVFIPKAHALFGHVAQERERRLAAEQQLTQQEQTNARLYIVISILSAGVVIALVAGAAAGSKTRRDHEAPL